MNEQNEPNSYMEIEDVVFDEFTLCYTRESILVYCMKREEYEEEEISMEWDCDMTSFNLN